MTQISIIQSGHINNWPTSDVGPYTAREWADRAYAVDQGEVATTGVLPLIANELEVTESPINVIRVDSGRAEVNGHYFSNSAAISFTPAAPAANPRIDVVVLVQNNTGIQRSAGIATPNNLIFPTGLADYAGSASIEPFTARLAILPGNEAAVPVAPTLDVDNTTLFMIPLAQYDIAVGGAVTNVTDLREVVESPTGSVVKITSVRLTAGAPNINITGITPLFADLRVVINARGDDANPNATINITFNGTGAPNYDYTTSRVTGTAVLTTLAAVGAAQIAGLVMPAATSPANYVGSYDLMIPGYSKSIFYKTVTGTGMYMDTAAAIATLFTMNVSGHWRQTVAINQIRLTPGAGNFVAGTTVELYGYSG